MKCFFQDLFKQPKKAPVDSFVQKYELLEADWLVEKIQLTSISLIRDASSHYRQLDLKNQWRANSMPVAEYYIFPISGDSQIQYARTRFGTIGCTIQVHDTGARILCHDRHATSRIVSFFGITANITPLQYLFVYYVLVALTAS